MIRRAWAVLADPPTSTDAWLLRTVALPLAAACVVGHALGWLPRLALLSDVVWLYALLAAVRDRDQARDDYAVLRRNACIVAAAYLRRGDG